MGHVAKHRSIAIWPKMLIAWLSRSLPHHPTPPPYSLGEFTIIKGLVSSLTGTGHDRS